MPLAAVSVFIRAAVRFVEPASNLAFSLTFNSPEKTVLSLPTQLLDVRIAGSARIFGLVILIASPAMKVFFGVEPSIFSVIGVMPTVIE